MSSGARAIRGLSTSYARRAAMSLMFGCTGCSTASTAADPATRSATGGAAGLSGGLAGRAAQAGSDTGSGGAEQGGRSPSDAGTVGLGGARAGSSGASASAGGGGRVATDGAGAGGAANGAAAGLGGVSNGGAGGAGRAGAAGAAGGSSELRTFTVFDQLPQFGIYVNHDPTFSPPAGVLMWNHGTVFVTQLTPEQKASIRATLAVRLTYHAQCDNYDRLGSLFFLSLPAGQTPKPEDPRSELVRYITPFSDYGRGALATYAYPEADVSAYASTLADPAKDVWLGLVSGANPYDGDPCTDAQVSSEFREVGYKLSVTFATHGGAIAASGTTLSALRYSSETKLPIAATFDNPGEALDGEVTVIVSGHGSDAGGDEYMNTHDTVTLNGSELGGFDTDIDCAPYASASPDGNPGIFRSNLGSNPRNWCPGALVAAHTFRATLKPGANTVSLAVSPSGLPSGSFYSTSINFTAP